MRDETIWSLLAKLRALASWVGVVIRANREIDVGSDTEEVGGALWGLELGMGGLQRQEEQ